MSRQKESEKHSLDNSAKRCHLLKDLNKWWHEGKFTFLSIGFSSSVELDKPPNIEIKNKFLSVSFTK